MRKSRWQCWDLLRGRAGHFRYFLIFSIIKNEFLHFLSSYNNLFLHQSYLKSPLPVNLTFKKSLKNKNNVSEKI